MSATMRERFYESAAELVSADERMAVVLADIGVGRMPATERAHPDRVINVGIREQLMIGVASGLALTGFRPIVHSFAPFVVERPFEMLKDFPPVARASPELRRTVEAKFREILSRL